GAPEVIIGRRADGVRSGTGRPDFDRATGGRGEECEGGNVRSEREAGGHDQARAGRGVAGGRGGLPGGPSGYGGGGRAGGARGWRPATRRTKPPRGPSPGASAPQWSATTTRRSSAPTSTP